VVVVGQAKSVGSGDSLTMRTVRSTGTPTYTVEKSTSVADRWTCSASTCARISTDKSFDGTRPDCTLQVATRRTLSGFEPARHRTLTRAVASLDKIPSGGSISIVAVLSDEDFLW